MKTLIIQDSFDFISYHWLKKIPNMEYDFFIFVIQNAFEPRSVLHPFLSEERLSLLKKSLPKQIKYATILQPNFFTEESQDENKYFSLMKEIDSLNIDLGDIHYATNYQKPEKYHDLILSFGVMNVLSTNVPIPYLDFIKTFRKTKEYRMLCNEDFAIKNNKREKNFYVAGDSCILSEDHVLLIKRKGSIGTNNWALPGGHIGSNEEIIKGAFRELKEETKINLTFDEYSSCIYKTKLFDNPNRSIKGRTISQVYYLKIPKMLDVIAADDASEVFWFPVADIFESLLLKDCFFEDHYEIIREI